MNVNQKNKVTWLTYPAFEKFSGIVHGFSTRLGGVSQGIYESMNLSFTRGDEESAVTGKLPQTFCCYGIFHGRYRNL